MKKVIMIYIVLEELEDSKFRTIMKISQELHTIPKKPLDILLNTKDIFDYRASNKSTLEYKILNEGVKLYG